MKFVDGPMKRLMFHRAKDGKTASAEQPSLKSPSAKELAVSAVKGLLSRPLKVLPIRKRTRPSNSEVRARFRFDLLGVYGRQVRALRAYEGSTQKPLPQRRSPKVAYPGLLDQKYAAAEREWRWRQCQSLRRAHGFTDRGTKIPTFTYAVTLAQVRWIRTGLSPSFLIEVRKAVQRGARRLTYPAVVTGVIDICPLNDHLSGVEGWSYHVHLTVQMAVRDFKTGRVAMKKAFPYKKNSLGGVSKPVDVRRAYYPRGWDHYSDKLMQWDGVRQRVVPVDRASGLRLKARKPEMTVWQRAEWAAFISQIAASDLMIWVGYWRRENTLFRK